MKTNEIASLCALLEVKLEAEKSKLAALAKTEAALRRQLQELAHSRKAAAHRTPGENDPALKSGADLRWQRWIESRLGLINQDLASTLARKSHQTERVRKAFGKHAAMKELGDRRAKEDALTWARKHMFD